MARAHVLVALVTALALALWPGSLWPTRPLGASEEAYGEAIAAPARVTFAFLWILGLGATKRCFGARRAAWLALAAGALVAEASARLFVALGRLEAWALLAVAAAGLVLAETVARCGVGNCGVGNSGAPDSDARNTSRALDLPPFLAWGAFAVFGWAYARGGLVVPPVALGPGVAARATGAGAMTVTMSLASARWLFARPARQRAASAAS